MSVTLQETIQKKTTFERVFDDNQLTCNQVI